MKRSARPRRSRRLLWRIGLAAALIGAGFAYQKLWRPPSPQELESLRVRQRELEARVASNLAPELARVAAREAGVLVAIPAPFAERLAQRATAGLLQKAVLTFRGIEVQKAGDVHGRILVGRKRLGTYAVAIRLDEVRAQVAAGVPALRFEGERIGVHLPVRLTGGSVRGTMRFQWDGRGVAGSVCGDVAFEGAIAGRLQPAAHDLQAHLELASDEAALFARPELQRVDVKLGVEPSAETWRLVDRLVQERGALCRAALKAADVPEKVRALVERGFAVSLPARRLRALRFPLALEGSIAVEGAPLGIQLRPAGVTVSERRLWYGADVRVLDARMGERPR